MRPTLFIPELLWPEPGDAPAWQDLDCPSLAWLLARGQLTAKTPRTAEDALAGLFGLTGPTAPFGALRLRGEADNAAAPSAQEDHWLCADPVHLRFFQERLILADAGSFALADDEADALVSGLNAQFGAMGRFHAATARRWYLRLETPLACATRPLSAVAGRQIHGELPPDPQALRLVHWQNEIQMFLHHHPVNARRAAAGQPAINSLWFWGAGAFPATPADNASRADFSGIWSDDPLPRGFARWRGIPAHPRPPSWPGWLAGLAKHAPASPLIVLDHLLSPALYEKHDDWRRALYALEEQWFAPLRQALGKTLSGATVIAPTVYGCLRLEISALQGWKFWRAPQPLAATATRLAAS